jgi:hypothetical protein
MDFWRSEPCGSDMGICVLLKLLHKKVRAGAGNKLPSGIRKLSGTMMNIEHLVGGMTFFDGGCKDRCIGIIIHSHVQVINVNVSS